MAAGVEEGADANRLLAPVGAATPPGAKSTDRQDEADQRLASRWVRLSALRGVFHRQLWKELDQALDEFP